MERDMRLASSGGPMAALTINLTRAQRQQLVELAAAHSIASGRPISVSALARELLREGMEHRGRAA